jgi:NADH dehydrogenase FAD-containing subunit
MKLANLAPLERDGSKAEITLIDPRDRFVFLPLLYELVTGELRDWEVAPVFTDLLQGSGIKFVQGSAVRIDQVLPATRTLAWDIALDPFSNMSAAR